MPVAGLDHRERGYLAGTIYARYGGNENGAAVLERLLDEEARLQARITGLALRLGYTLSGGVPGGLSRSRLALEGNALVLTLGGSAVRRHGESVQRRLDALGRSLGRRTEVKRA